MDENKTNFSETTDEKTESSNNSGEGTLRVQVTTAGGAVPIDGATVTITDKDGNFIEKQTTDNSGRTEPVALPAPPFEYSQKPGSILPYSTYSMRVEMPGYYTEEFLNIAVFDTVASIQPVALEPLGENATENDRLIVIDEEMKDRL